MDKLFKIMQTIFTLKATTRTGWNKKPRKNEKWRRRVVKNAESVADHSFSTAFMAMMVAKLFKLDQLKMVKMALVHDLAESITGDIVTETERGAKKRRMELKKQAAELAAMEEIFVGFSGGDEYINLWIEFEEQSTPEARIVRQLDKIEAVLQAHYYKDQGQKVQPEEFLFTARPLISEPLLKELLEFCFQSDKSE